MEKTAYLVVGILLGSLATGAMRSAEPYECTWI